MRPERDPMMMYEDREEDEYERLPPSCANRHRTIRCEGCSPSWLLP